MRPSCCSVSWTFGASTTLIVPSFYRRDLDNHIAEQLCLAAQAVRLLELLVRLVGSGRREVVPALHNLDPASPARAVAAADVTDADVHLAGARQERFALGELRRLPCVDEDHARHGRRILHGRGARRAPAVRAHAVRPYRNARCAMYELRTSGADST